MVSDGASFAYQGHISTDRRVPFVTSFVLVDYHSSFSSFSADEATKKNNANLSWPSVK